MRSRDEEVCTALSLYTPCVMCVTDRSQGSGRAVGERLKRLYGEKTTRFVVLS